MKSELNESQEEREISAEEKVHRVIDELNKKMADEGIEVLIGGEDDFDEDDDDLEEDYNQLSVQTESRAISFIEMAMINTYMYQSSLGKHKDFIVKSYGTTDAIGRLSFGSSFSHTNAYWFIGHFANDIENECIVQTKAYIDERELNIQLQISCQKTTTGSDFNKLFKKILSLSFNNSEYKGKCIKVKLKDGRFKGIEVIDMTTSENQLILNETQQKYINHFISRVGRGKTSRYLFNGEPGTGKTESIREIARRLLPHVTFVIPVFDTNEDLTEILEACEVFDRVVIIMDDIDLYLGSRSNGQYTNLLGQFLSFFDGVKKRKISLLASTNDKGRVDKAAERPGRFNIILDYSFLDDEQIIKVCEIHLPEKWRVAEVHEALIGKVNGKKLNVTGAFIANLAENIKEMSEDENENEWTVEDTISLILESYKGFYSNQSEKKKNSLGFEN